MDLKTKTNLYLQALFYSIAGVNHFWHPDFYLKLIPDYFPFVEWINGISGSLECLFGLGLLFESSRKLSAYSIILLLLAFIPSHVYVIQIGACIEDSLCVPNWICWVRLLIVHPILAWWALSVRNYTFSIERV